MWLLGGGTGYIPKKVRSSEGEYPVEYRSQSIKMNPITVSFHGSEPQHSKQIQELQSQLSAKSKALIQTRTYSEMIKCSSDECVSWHWHAGNFPQGNPRCQYISDDSTVHVVLLRHHAVPVHAVLSVTRWALLTLIPWQPFGKCVTQGEKLIRSSISSPTVVLNKSDS